ncbi:MAG: hypothetical protein H0T89_22775 [Deltaproteobacteria bacterium]|nr:hypothetical protein [Deltaproteobacteria bacterium]MDQ3298206.1 hypothetical protein [Myxococcota bacterium]
MMIIRRISACVLLAAAMLATGCKKKEAASTSTGSVGSGSPTVVIVDSGADPANAAGSAAPPAGSGVASTNPPPKIGTGDPASLAALTAIKLPLPTGVATTLAWQDVSVVNADGDRRSNLEDGEDHIMSVHILDCRQTILKDYISKPANERGDNGYCFDPPTGMLKGFDLIAPTGAVQRAVRAGNITVIATAGTSGDKRVKTDGLAAWLEMLDLAAIARM